MYSGEVDFTIILCCHGVTSLGMYILYVLRSYFPWYVYTVMYSGEVDFTIILCCHGVTSLGMYILYVLRSYFPWYVYTVMYSGEVDFICSVVSWLMSIIFRIDSGRKFHAITLYPSSSVIICKLFTFQLFPTKSLGPWQPNLAIIFIRLYFTKF